MKKGPNAPVDNTAGLTYFCGHAFFSVLTRTRNLGDVPSSIDEPEPVTELSCSLNSSEIIRAAAVDEGNSCTVFL